MFGAADSPIKLTEIRLPTARRGGAPSDGVTHHALRCSRHCSLPLRKGHPVRLMHDRFDQFRLGLKRPRAKMTGATTVGSDMSLQCVQMTMNFGCLLQWLLQYKI
jgi:hypothetical protein